MAARGGLEMVTAAQSPPTATRDGALLALRLYPRHGWAEALRAKKSLAGGASRGPEGKIPIERRAPVHSPDSDRLRPKPVMRYAS